MQTVYVDILLLTNYIIDYFLLLLTASLSKTPKKRWRMLLGGALAAVTSLMIFAPELPSYIEMAVNLILSAIIVLAAFGFKNRVIFFKNVVIFYAANVILAGGTLLLWSLFKIPNIAIRNGVVFYNISPVILVLSTLTVYLVSLLVAKMIARKKGALSEYELTLFMEGKSVTLLGLVDSGNLLCDAISGNPVIVCEYQKIKPIFSSEMQRILGRKNFELGFYEDILNSGYSSRFRVIPYDSLGEGGVMMAFMLDAVSIRSEEGQQKIENVIMAVTHKKIAGGEFDALINPEFVTI